MALIKVRGTGEKRVEALRIADIFRARVVDATTESFVFEMTGSTDKLERLHRPDAAARPGRGVAHRRRRDRARARGALERSDSTLDLAERKPPCAFTTTATPT